MFARLPGMRRSCRMTNPAGSRSLRWDAVVRSPCAPRPHARPSSGNRSSAKANPAPTTTAEVLARGTPRRGIAAKKTIAITTTATDANAGHAIRTRRRWRSRCRSNRACAEPPAVASDRTGASADLGTTMGSEVASAAGASPCCASPAIPRLPQHFGKRSQAQKDWPSYAPRRAVRTVIDPPHRGQAGGASAGGVGVDGDALRATCVTRAGADPWGRRSRSRAFRSHV
jgi:hypothetical protein